MIVGVLSVIGLVLLIMFVKLIEILFGSGDKNHDEKILVNDIKGYIKDLERIKNNPYTVTSEKLRADEMESIEEKIIQYEYLLHGDGDEYDADRNGNGEFTEKQLNLVRCRAAEMYARRRRDKYDFIDSHRSIKFLYQDHQEFCVGWKLDSECYDDNYKRRIQVYKDDAREKSLAKGITNVNDYGSHSIAEAALATNDSLPYEEPVSVNNHVRLRDDKEWLRGAVVDTDGSPLKEWEDFVESL